MPKRAKARPAPDPVADAAPATEMPEDNFVASLKEELQKTQKRVAEKPGEDLTHRAELNRRLLQDLWEVHNEFEEISVHLTVEPSQTLFATFVEYPQKWSFRDSFDFGGVKTIELKDRTPAWLGTTLRFWYYKTPEGKTHLRGIFEWSEGESYHRYSGWMRMMAQAVLYDSAEHSANLREIHQILKDVVVKWYAAHIDRAPETFVAHLKEKYPKGASYAVESYRA
jgi:hypothetical protein